MIFAENSTNAKLPQGQTQTEINSNLEVNKENINIDEDFSLEDQQFRALRKKYPYNSVHSTFSKDILEKTPSMSDEMIVDMEEIPVPSQPKLNSRSFSDSDSEDEEILLEWGFDQILPSENQEKIFLPSNKIKMSLTSSTSTAMSNFQEENLNKIEDQPYSEFHQTFGIVSLSSEENRREFLEEKEEKQEDFTAEKFEVEDLSCDPPELQVTVNTNNNNHINNNQVVARVLKVIENLKNKSQNVIEPYEEIHIGDPNLIDYYLSDFYSLNKKKKSQLTGKQLDDGSHVPPLPSEILEHFRRVKKNFTLRFNHNCVPFRIGINKNYGYCFSIRCETMNIDQYYTVSDSGLLPFGKLREYSCQAILMLMYPNVKKWVDLLKILNFKI
jgi:hypothetical protein